MHEFPDGILWPISFASRLLSKPGHNYSIIYERALELNSVKPLNSTITQEEIN